MRLAIHLKETIMHTLFRALALSLAMLIPVCANAAADKGSADEAIAMVKKATALIKQVGREKAYAEINDPANHTFHDRDLYVFVHDLNGVMLAHGNNKRLINKNVIDLKDADGKPIIKAFIDVAKSPATKGWSEYKWPNPVTGAVDKKSSYVELSDDIVVGAGIYK
jgi:cytochrome c